MPNEIYPISNFGYSKDDGFGSIYHHYKNVSEEPEEPREASYSAETCSDVVTTPEGSPLWK